MILKPGMLCSYTPHSLNDWVMAIPELNEDEYYDTDANQIIEIDEGLVIYLEHAESKWHYRWTKVIYGEVIGWVAGHLTPVVLEEDL